MLIYLLLTILFNVFINDAVEIVNGGRYRLSNAELGPCLSLSSYGNQIIMKKTAYSKSQLWIAKKHPKLPNTFKLSSASTRKVMTRMSSKRNIPKRSRTRISRAINRKSPSSGRKTSRVYFSSNRKPHELTKYWRIVDVKSSPDKWHTYQLVSAFTDGSDADTLQAAESNSIIAGTAVPLKSEWMIYPAEKVTGLPASMRSSTFYRKYLDMDGIPVVSSKKVPDDALYQAYFLLRHLLSAAPAIHRSMVQHGAKLAVMADTEFTTSIPEHSFLEPKFWNARARGLGGTVAVPTASCAEENLLCYKRDKYRSEDITVHEITHSMHTLGLNFVHPNFNSHLAGLYNAAKAEGKWLKTYAATNPTEYFAEGVQNWFNVNTESIPPNGIHNHVNTREELATYDPGLYSLIKQWFPSDTNKCSCH